ncbi:MAG: hypothetical protein KDD70_05925 [Bdellovibrionales bacterium]|nr:hypothetical protein [Bdellovibrionales bacterium]
MLECVPLSEGREAEPDIELEMASLSAASKRSGVNKHTEHMADTVLDLAPGAETKTLPTFEAYRGFMVDLMDQIKSKEITFLNEKFDGSPALLLGYDGEGKPFVAYKHGLGSSRGQRIVRSAADAKELFPEDSPMKGILSDCIRYLRQRLERFEEKNVMFQADLLFTPNNGAKQIPASGDVLIQPNAFGVEYRLKEGSKFHAHAKEARVGLVVHSALRREIDSNTGQVTEGDAISDPAVVENFVRAIRSKAVFAIDPWSRRIDLRQEGIRDFPEGKERRLKRELEEMGGALATLSPEFRTAWGRVSKYFQQYVNSHLKEGKSGGLLKAASGEEPFDFAKLVRGFSDWVTEKSTRVVPTKTGKKTEIPKVTEERLGHILKEHLPELHIAFKAYYDANRIQGELKPFMTPVYQSKLGGGRIEGVIFSDDTTIVKLVDRLDFSKNNFSGEAERRRAARARYRERLRETAERTQVKDTKPSPFTEWQPDAVFIVGKFQPPHSGHIAFIKKVQEEAGDKPVYVLASNKQPDLDAEKWNNMGVSTKARKGEVESDLRAARYDRVFSVDFRADCFREAFGDELAGVHFLSPREFWSYVREAKREGRPGKVRLAVGKKEIDEGRYSDQFARYGSHVEALTIEMQKDGVSGTEMKTALRNLALHGDEGSYQHLRYGFDYMPAGKRSEFIHRAYQAWVELHEEVQERITPIE